MTTTQWFLGAVLALMITASTNAQSAPSPVADLTIVTGLDEDVAATKRVLDQLDGPVILVGNSYGGSIISHPHDVARLIETAARAVE